MKILKRYFLILLSILVVLSTCTVTFAATGDEVYFYGTASSHDVTVNGQNKTIYCLQSDYVWPTYGNSPDKVPTKFVEADASNHLLTDNQLKILQRLMFAGYPHNAEGIFDDFYSFFGPDDDTSYIDTLAADITQQAIWIYTSKWGIEGNKPINVGELDSFFTEHIEKLIEFAESDTPVTLPSSSHVEIEGSAEFSKHNGILKTGELRITKPNNYKLRFQLELPAGITAEDKDGNDITSILENEPFHLVASDASYIEAAAQVKVSAKASCPTAITHYLTNDDNGHPTKPKKYQSMLCVGIETKALSGTLSLKQQKYGDLVIEKLVTEDSKTYATSKEFDFKVKLTGAKVTDGTYKVDIYNVSDDGSRHHSKKINVDCVSGLMEFKMKANQEAEILNIPEGTHYSVSEKTDDGWKATYKDKEGTIIEDGDVFSTVINTYEFEPVSTNIELKKELKNGSTSMPLADDQFEFELVPGHGQHAPMPGNAVALTAGNKADGTITFGEFTFDKPGEYIYIIGEKGVTTPNVDRDRSYYEAIVPVTVGSDNKLHVGSITFKKHSDDHLCTDVSTALFTNKYTPNQTSFDLSVLKEINNESSDKIVPVDGYKFKIQPAEGVDTTNYPDFGTDGKSCVITTDENGVSFTPRVTINVTQFDTMFGSTATEGQLKYTISEVEGNKPGVSYLDTEVDVVVTVHKNGTQMYTETTFDGSSDYPIYVNEYSAEGTINLTVDKEFNPTDYTPAVGESYEFSVTDDEKSYDDITIEWDGNQWVQTGGSIDITKAGLYKYYISEKDVDKANMHKDHTVWTATVVALENDDPNGELDVKTPTYTKAGSDSVSKPTFVNTYTPSVVRPDIEISKELVGRDWHFDDLFDVTVGFAYTDSTDSQEFDPLKNIEHEHKELLEKDGITFHKQELTETGTYYYVIREAKGNAPAMEYDNRTFIVKYVVTKDGADLVISEPEITVKDGDDTKTANEVKFVNTVSHGNLTIKKTVDDKSGKLDLSEEKFTFEVEILHSDFELHAFSGKYGDVEFEDGVAKVTLKHGESITVKGLPADHYYRVTEIDSEGYSTTVQVDNDEITSDNEVSAKIPEGTAEISFVNTKESNPSTDDNDDSDDSDDSIDNEDNEFEKSNAVDTGDHNQIALYISTMVTAIMLLLIMFIKKRRD